MIKCSNIRTNPAALVMWAIGLLLGAALVMGLMVGIPATDIAGLIAIGAGLIAFEAAPSRRKVWTGGWILAWAGTLAAPATVVFRKEPVYDWDCFFAVWAWLIAAAILITGNRATDSRFRTRWRMLGLTWAFSGELIWLTTSYLQNYQGVFLAGLPIGLALLFLCKRWFSLPRFGIQVANTLILLLIGLPLTDLVFSPADHLNAIPDPAQRAYSYETAKRDRAMFVRWWKYYFDQVISACETLMIRDPGGNRKYQLRPGSEAMLFQCRISINSKGFRGREFSAGKGGAYRIVALGESTTFGLTLNAGDKPWPELLEQMIRDRIKPGRPIEVINAGIPSIDLEENLTRLPAEILPLQPDMIISYHGYNGFHLIADSVPSVQANKRPPPAYRRRPLKLLADCEYNLKLIRYKHGPTLSLRQHPPVFPALMETEYARCYRQLIEVTRTNGIHLVLANYPMAVSDQSDSRVIEFYRETFPFVYSQIKANRVHSEIVDSLWGQNPDLCQVDLRPGLDGAHDRFIDLMHLTQEGRQLVAERMFAGIRVILENELGQRKASDGGR